MNYRLEDVVKEIETIREKASPEEKARLDFYTLEPGMFHRCIYGQMTGSCTSMRAHDLMGLNPGQRKERITKGVADHMTPLESFIIVRWGYNKEILQYIKGEIDELPILAVTA